jgi:hypothetical protein
MSFKIKLHLLVSELYVFADSLKQLVMAVVWGRSRFPTGKDVVKYSYLTENTARPDVLKVVPFRVYFILVLLRRL